MVDTKKISTTKEQLVNEISFLNKILRNIKNEKELLIALQNSALKRNDFEEYLKLIDDLKDLTSEEIKYNTKLMTKSLLIGILEAKYDKEEVEL